jgi:capsule polysaccharide export protein KpsE/RkpR
MWEENDLLKAAIQQIQNLNTRERDVAARELTAEKQRVEIAEKERDIEKARAEFYKANLESVTKKRGLGCSLKKAFSLGLAKC